MAYQLTNCPNRSFKYSSGVLGVGGGRRGAGGGGEEKNDGVSVIVPNNIN